MGMTATQLGTAFGRGAAAMNVLLKDHGFIEGSPGAWRTTELGKQFATSVDFDNGYGGFAHRSWGWLSWSDGLVDALRASIEANPQGIMPPVPTAVASVATVTATGTGGQASGKYKWAVMAALGVAAVAAPVAKSVRTRIAERRAAAKTTVAPEEPAESSGMAGLTMEDLAAESD